MLDDGKDNLNVKIGYTLLFNTFGSVSCFEIKKLILLFVNNAFIKLITRDSKDFYFYKKVILQINAVLLNVFFFKES